MHAANRIVRGIVLVFAAQLGLGVSPSSARDSSFIPDGEGQVTITVGRHHMQVFTYRAATNRETQGPLIMVFHGHNRNADGYRDHARKIAEESGGLVVCACYDQKHFPKHAYNEGNVMGHQKHRKMQPRRNWTFSIVPKLIDRIRAMEGRPNMPYYLLGHSAGGQFVERLMALGHVHPVRAVAANPGSHMFPTRRMQYPYGFGRLSKSLSNDRALQHYLAAPMTIYLGTADTDPNHPDLDRSRTAETQGRHRLARGHNCYEAARRLARSKGWAFNWRLVEAPHIDHSGGKMFNNDACWQALFGNHSHAPNLARR